MGNPLQKVFEFIKTSSSSRTISIIVIFIIAAAIPLTVIVSQQQQEIRQRAAPTSACPSGNVAFDNKSQSSISQWPPINTLEWNHTIGGSNDRLLLVGVNLRTSSGGSINTVKYNGINLTRLGIEDNIGGSVNPTGNSLWYLLNPPSGTYPIQVSANTSLTISAGAVSFSNVNQSVPFGTPVVNKGTSSSPSVSGNGAACGVVVDHLSTSTPATCTASPDSSQTSIWNVNAPPNSNGNGAGKSAGSRKDSSDSFSMSWNMSCGGNWVLKAVSIVAKDAAPTLTPTLTPTPTLRPGTNRISGTVYIDTNRNGIKDTGEIGYSGAIINRDGTITAITDSSGYYAYTNALAGTHTLILSVPSGYVLTTGNNPATVTVPPEAILDFGIAPSHGVTLTPTPTLRPGTNRISGTVYIDTNRNGIKDTGEIGYSGAIINRDGTITAITDSSGYYAYTNALAGTHTLILSVPSGYVLTTGNNPATVTVPPNAIVNFGIVLISTRTPTPALATVSVSWSCPSGNVTANLSWSSNPNAQGYRVFHRISGATGQIFDGNTPLTTRTIPALTANTNYDFNVYWLNATGQATIWASSLAQNSGNPCGSPLTRTPTPTLSTEMLTVSTDCSTATLRWRPRNPGDNYWPARRCLSCSDTSWRYTTSPVTSTSHTFAALNIGWTYEFKVDVGSQGNLWAGPVTARIACASTPTPTPTSTPPNCNSGQQCTACTAPVNTCNGTGTQTCTYTTYNGSTNCRQVSQNVSCSNAPANCTNGNICVNNQCVAPTSIPTPTTPWGGTPTPTPTTGVHPTATPQPTIPAGNTVFALNIGLDGIGTTGDNTNPGNHSGSNKNPLRSSRSVTIEVFDNNNASVANKSGTLTYQAGSGKFTGTVDMGSLASANYNVKVKSPGYLRRLVPGIQNVTSGQTYNLPGANLVTGDINGDNAINILDYNIFISCSIFSKDNHGACNGDPNYIILADLDDNGTIDQFDYNLFVRELSVQNGD